MSVRNFLFLVFLVQITACIAQKTVTDKPAIKPAEAIKQWMTPELLWKVKRVYGLGVSIDANHIVYRVSTPLAEENKFTNKFYKISVNGGEPEEVNSTNGLVKDKNISFDGKYRLIDKAVKIDPVNGYDFYPDLKNATAQIYTSLDYRHWDTWNDGHFNHVFFGVNGAPDSTYIDIMKGEGYNSPQKPFGGDEDYLWSPDNKSILYVSKKLKGTKAAQSTNTDIFQYDLYSKSTKNLTESNKGYDTNPTFSSKGDLAYLSMKTDGYESDKNDIKVISKGITTNLTAHWDESVLSYFWALSADKIYFTAAVNGTIQLFEVDYPGMAKKIPVIQQLSKGDWDINSIIGQSGTKLIVTRTSINHAAEVFTYEPTTNSWNQITHVNKSLYSNISECKTERRFVTTTDKKKMLVWVVYPPNFDASKKYPTLLYCQGGPQSALTQFYSFRWNLHLMASQGYIVVAPNRRGMPGHGVEWNKQISKDWGGQNIKDYLSAIDDIAKESYVDNKRLGAVGASYGGYSVFYLAGIHNKRFKSFIAHDGVFNTQSMYGTTEEVFFTNYDFGGPYWDDKYKKIYTDFNPITKVAKWDTPIFIIQGGKDFRIPLEQGMEAFNAAQLLGIKSKFLYLPDENHWVTKPQNSLVWQREFFKWLKETL